MFGAVWTEEWRGGLGLEIHAQQFNRHVLDLCVWLKYGSIFASVSQATHRNSYLWCRRFGMLKATHSCGRLKIRVEPLLDSQKWLSHVREMNVVFTFADFR